MHSSARRLCRRATVALAVAVAVALAVALAAGLLGPGPAPARAAPARAATVHHVPGDFATITAAIGAAAPGDTVLVADGTWSETLVVAKPITVESVNGAGATILDGGGSGTWVVNLSGAVTLRGFTIQHGGGGNSGGGVIVTDNGAVVEQNRIVDNLACGEGGGIDVAFAVATIADNYIARNHSSCTGGMGGGGIALRGAGSVQVLRNVIEDNGMASAPGGGIAVLATAAVIHDNLIIGNSGEHGGGISVSSASVDIANNLIAGNDGGALGGGVRVAMTLGQEFPPAASIVHNTIADNVATTGSAAGLTGDASRSSLRNNILSGNTAGSLLDCSWAAPGTADGNDLWNDDGPEDSGVCAGTAASGTSLSVAPGYLDPLDMDYHLRPDSPLLDKGVGSPWPATDIDGDTRPFDGDESGTAGPDPGYDESTDALLVEPGRVDLGDVVAGAPLDAPVTLTNLGSGPLSITSIDIGGDHPDGWSVPQETCTGVVLAVDASCVATVRLSPAAFGELPATLVIKGPGDVGTRTHVLTATVMDTLSVPGGVAFDGVPRTTSADRTLGITNFGLPATVTDAAIQGPSAADFAIQTDHCSGIPIPTAQGCEITVRFTPGALGAREASLVLAGAFPVGTRTIALTGEGTPPPSGVGWGTIRKAGPAYTWNFGASLGRTVQSGTQRLHLAYATDRVGGSWAKDGGPYAGVYYVRSTSGATWSSPKRLNPSNQHATRIALAASGSRVYAAWVSQTRYTRYSRTAPRVLFVRVNSGHGASTSWRSTIRLSATSGRVDYPTVSATGDLAYVAWTDSGSGSVRVARSRDKGASWRTASVGSTTRSNSSGRIGLPVVAASGSTVLVAWVSNADGAIKARVSTDRASTWGPTVTVAAASDGELGAALRGSRAAITWVGAEGLLVRLRTGGAWGAPVVVSPHGAGSYSPAVALQDPNRVAVAWSFSAEPSASSLHWAESADGGSTWYADEEVATTGSSSRRANDYPSMIWPTAGMRYVAWNGWTPGTTSYRQYVRAGSGTPVGVAALAPVLGAVSDGAPAAGLDLPAAHGSSPAADGGRTDGRPGGAAP